MQRRFSVATAPPVAKQKLGIDLQDLSINLMRDPNKLNAIIRRFEPSSLMGFLGISLGTEQNGISEVSIGRGQVDDSMIKWRIYDDSPVPIEVLDATSIPGTLYPGVTYSGLGLNEGWMEADAVIGTENPDYMIILVERKATMGAKFYYDFQVIGSDPTSGAFPVALLQPGRKVEYKGNAKGERSSNGQPVAIQFNRAEDFYNVTTVSRHDYDISGHALSTKPYTYLYEQMGNDPKKLVGALPFSAETIRQHLRSINAMLWGSRGNFDPVARKIINQSPFGTRTERPILSGLREQLNSTANTYEYFPLTDSLTSIANKLDFLVQAQRNYLRLDPTTKVEYVLLTRSGGEAVITRAWEKKFKSDPIQIHDSLDSSRKVNVGYEIGYYTTVFGQRMKLRNLDYAMDRNAVAEYVSYEGMQYDKQSFDIYILPIYRLSKTLNRNNISVLTKVKDGINRGLVIGYQSGMTGFSNGGAIPTSADAERIAASIASKGVNSPVDEEKMMTLSEYTCAVYNPDEIFYLKARFASGV